jgi:hypothetical protein
MFKWLKTRAKNEEENHAITFDLTPLVNQLSYEKKNRLDDVADLIYNELHSSGIYLDGYKTLLEGGWIFYDYRPIISFGVTLHLRLNDLVQDYSGNPSDLEAREYYSGWQKHRREHIIKNYRCFFPLLTLQTVHKLSRHLMPSYRKLNLSQEAADLKILDLISIEASCRILMDTRVDLMSSDILEILKWQMKNYGTASI